MGGIEVLAGEAFLFDYVNKVTDARQHCCTTVGTSLVKNARTAGSTRLGKHHDCAITKDALNVFFNDVSGERHARKVAALLGD